MTSQQPDILVIRAGVSGLTTAICLAEAGSDVTVAAADLPLLTTSAAAGAVWVRTWSAWTTGWRGGAG